MSVYYDYYLEYHTEDGWHQLSNPDSDDSETVYWHTGSYGSEFVRNYEEYPIPFSEYSIELQTKYKAAYEKSLDSSSIFIHDYPKYYKLDLEMMIQDYQNGIHEYVGIISKNDMLKVQRDAEYNPKLIEPNDFAALPEGIKENYIFYAWDSPWSEYGHIYDIVPVVLKLMNDNHLSLEDVRLVYC